MPRLPSKKAKNKVKVKRKRRPRATPTPPAPALSPPTLEMVKKAYDDFLGGASRIDIEATIMGDAELEGVDKALLISLADKLFERLARIPDDVRRGLYIAKLEGLSAKMEADEDFADAARAIKMAYEISGIGRAPRVAGLLPDGGTETPVDALVLDDEPETERKT